MLAIKYREVNAKGEISGGPMYTMKKALKHKRFGSVLGWLEQSVLLFLFQERTHCIFGVTDFGVFS